MIAVRFAALLIEGGMATNGRGQPSGFATVQIGWEMIQIGSDRVVCGRSGFGIIMREAVTNTPPGKAILMTLDELATSLPNGLHDAELHNCTIDYTARSVQLVLKLWMGRPEHMEVYRPAIIHLTGMHFWIIEPPDPKYPGDSASLTIDAGEVSALGSPPKIHLPDKPQAAFVSWIYVRQWNAFIYVAAEAAELRWTGPEEDQAGKPDPDTWPLPVP